MELRHTKNGFEDHLQGWDWVQDQDLVQGMDWLRTWSRTWSRVWTWVRNWSMPRLEEKQIF